MHKNICGPWNKSKCSSLYIASYYSEGCGDISRQIYEVWPLDQLQVFLANYSTAHFRYFSIESLLDPLSRIICRSIVKYIAAILNILNNPNYTNLA